MRILFVSPRQFWPVAGGSKLRDYHCARALGQLGALTCVFFREPAFDPPKPADLPFAERIVTVPPPQAYTAGRILKGLTSLWPLPVLNYTSEEMKAALRQELSSGRWDAVHFEGIHLAAYAALVREGSPGTPIVFNWHNIESEGMRRFAELTPSSLKRIYASMTASRLQSVENTLLETAAGNVVCSARERDHLLAGHPGARVAVIENGVDTAAYESISSAPVRNRIVFVGLMAYHANVDAAVWFVRNVWPLVRSQMPGVIFTIVGANPAPAVLELKNEPGVEVTGTVPDVRPWYGQAIAAAVPLRVGAGTRLKILEAMAAGVPVVSTAVGAEGLAVSPGNDILIAETAEDWVRALTELQNPVRAASITAAARNLVATRYDWNIIGQTLRQTYGSWLGNR